MRIVLTNVFVDDQEKALAFYTSKLGFIKKDDVPMGEDRWLTLVSPDARDGTELLLEPSSHPAVGPFKDALVADGIPYASFEVDDVDAEYERMQAAGVRFVQFASGHGRLQDRCFRRYLRQPDPDRVIGRLRAMATQEDVRRMALSLPETEEGDDRFAFSVRGKGKPKGFVWVWLERIEPKKARVPNPEVIAIRVANLDEKDIILSIDESKFFTEPHYNGYPAVLIRLAARDGGGVGAADHARVGVSGAESAGEAIGAIVRAGRPVRRVCSSMKRVAGIFFDLDLTLLDYDDAAYARTVEAVCHGVSVRVSGGRSWSAPDYPPAAQFRSLASHGRSRYTGWPLRGADLAGDLGRSPGGLRLHGCRCGPVSP